MRPIRREIFKLLNDTLQEMGALVAHSVHKSVFSLIDKNEDYAHQVLRDEQRIDQMEIQIDDLAASLIVREQPVARDMRFVVVAIKINTDLERMGDLAVNVVERTLAMMAQPALPEVVDFREIAESRRVDGAREPRCIREERDAQIARGVLSSDDAVDKCRNAIQQQIVGLMQRDPSTIPRAVDHLIIARSLERIADHATNVAEDVIFMVQGIDVRHQPAGEAA